MEKTESQQDNLPSGPNSGTDVVTPLSLSGEGNDPIVPEEDEVEEDEEEEDEEEGEDEEEEQVMDEYEIQSASPKDEDEEEVDADVEDDEEEEDHDIYGIGMSVKSEGGVTTTSSLPLPKMRTRFSMSNQQILDLNDPYNQRTFEDNISRLNHLLENNQKEYCLINYRGQNPEVNEFRLHRNLLAKVVYQDELDLTGNFLQQIVGRRLNDDDMPQLAEFLSTEAQVSRLNLAYNNFGDDAVSTLAGVLLVRGDIYHVNLAHNDITPRGCSQFLESLMQRSPLHSLKLSGIKLGKEGFDSLICLVMCGRGPYDLDVSESDMSMADFQGLCSSWQAIDRDEDFPKFLVDHPLPIPLEVLADMKVANNEMKRQEYNLIQRRSIVELIRKDAGDMRSETRMEKIPEIPKQDFGPLQDPSRLVEKVSATILHGLFEIPELTSMANNNSGDYGTDNNYDDAIMTTTLDRGQAKIDMILKKSQKLPDTGLIIDEFKKIKEAGCIPFDAKGRPVIVCPSLYSLNADNILELESTITGHYGHFIPSPLDDLVEGAQEMARIETQSTKAPDDETAQQAANKVVTRVLAEAAKFSSNTEYDEKSDAAQILLASVLTTCQRVKELEDSSAEFAQEDLNAIWDNATQETVNLIYKRIPPERCSLSPKEIMSFVRKFMESANRTLLRLLQNPFIPPLLLDVGNAVCKEVAAEESFKRVGQEGGGGCCSGVGEAVVSDEGGRRSVITNADGRSMEGSNVQRIITSFLEGAVTAAATLIGSADPFSLRSREPGSSLTRALEASQHVAEETEGRVGRTVKDFILAGASLSVDASNANKKLETVLDTSLDPAVEFLEEAFDQVANLIIEMEKRRNEHEVPVIKFPFASKPTRLVLNRPIFQDFEPIMAAKMGDFLQLNTSVKCLHMRKWNLGEDGMISLMDGLLANSNIVLFDIGCNAIGPEGAKCLARFIQLNQNLKHLILNHNRLRNPGLRYLTEALPGSSVEFLNIAYNDIAESLEQFFEILPNTRIRSLYALGNRFNQASWTKLKYLFDTEWLLPEYCDFLLQDVDGSGMIVKNAQTRDANEWYDVQPLVARGLYRAPYFEETAHITTLLKDTY